MDSLQDDDELSDMWRNWKGKWYKKVLLLVCGLAVLIVLWIVFTFAVALFMEATKTESGEDTKVEQQKKGWWE